MQLGYEDGDVLYAVAEELEFAVGRDFSFVGFGIMPVNPDVLVEWKVKVPPLCYLKFLVEA